MLSFSQAAKKWLQQCLVDTLSLDTDVDLLFKTLCSEKHSIQSFAQHSLFAFKSISELNLQQKKEMPLIWDTILLQSLRQENLEKLKRSCITFTRYTADMSSKEQSFCFFWNPRVEEIELASINKETLQIVPFGKGDGIK
jgi:hypothetical protein